MKVFLKVGRRGKKQQPSNSPGGEPQHGLIGGAGFQILSALTSRLWPDFTWQPVQFCPNCPPAQKTKKKNCTLGRGMGCIVVTTRESGQRRVAGDGFGESAAGRVAEQMGLHAARPRRPLVPHLPSQSTELPQRVENIWSF